MADLNEGDYICMVGGQYKGWQGVIEKLKPTFCVVEMKLNKKGETIHTDRLKKCARKYMVIKDPDPIEMPSMEDCVVVDDVNAEPILNKTFMEEIISNETIIGESPIKITEEVSPFLPQEQDKPKSSATIIHENCVREPALMIDEAFKIRDERDRLLNVVKYYDSVNIPELFRKLSLLEHEVEQLREETKWKGVEIDKLDSFKLLLEKIKVDM